MLMRYVLLVLIIWCFYARIGWRSQLTSEDGGTVVPGFDYRLDEANRTMVLGKVFTASYAIYACSVMFSILIVWTPLQNTNFGQTMKPYIVLFLFHFGLFCYLACRAIYPPVLLYVDEGLWRRVLQLLPK